MVSAQDKQGFLGDLTSHSKLDLIDLLNRQEKLASNKKFLSRLADKGAKIHAMIDRIKEAIAQVERVDETTDLFEKMAIKSEQKRQQRLQYEDSEEDIELLKKLARRGEQEKQVTEEPVEEPSDVQEFMNSYEKVIKSAEKRPQEKKGKFLPNRSIRSQDVHNVVEKISGENLQRDVVTMDDLTSGESPKVVEVVHNFNVTDEGLNNRKVKTDEKLLISMDDMDSTQGSEGKSTELTDSPVQVSTDGNSSQLAKSESGNIHLSSNQTESLHPPSCDSNIVKSKAALPRGKLRYKYDECLETDIYTKAGIHESAKLISIEESVGLQQTQERHLQELQALHAAEKLAQRLEVRMSAFNPEGASDTKMRYREAAVDSDEDEDEDSDDKEDLDYPD